MPKRMKVFLVTISSIAVALFISGILVSQDISNRLISGG